MYTSNRNKGVIVSLAALLTAISLLLPTQAYYLTTTKPITKGSDGYSCIYLLTFKHESLIPYLKTDESKKGLYLVDLSFIERNADVVELLIEQNHTVGLISYSNTEQFDAQILKRELALFKEKVGSPPLWATVGNGEFDDELMKSLHAASINALAANTYFNPTLSPSTIPKGSFLFIKSNQDFDFRAKAHLRLVTSAQVRTIEENLFSLKSNSKDAP